ncbi:MAG: hypothetical protein JNN15_13530 [Blastocatellia bacterium]|nr:hypothetical protein [Blastocatellia bacterium]
MTKNKPSSATKNRLSRVAKYGFLALCLLCILAIAGYFFDVLEYEICFTSQVARVSDVIHKDSTLYMLITVTNNKEKQTISSWLKGDKDKIKSQVFRKDSIVIAYDGNNFAKHYTEDSDTFMFHLCQGNIIGLEFLIKGLKYTKVDPRRIPRECSFSYPFEEEWSQFVPVDPVNSYSITLNTGSLLLETRTDPSTSDLSVEFVKESDPSKNLSLYISTKRSLIFNGEYEKLGLPSLRESDSDIGFPSIRGLP